MTSGTHTLLGTQNDDVFETTKNFSAIAAGRGNDTLSGSDASERFYGGAGDDLIHWNKGYNLVHGGQWRMAYAKDGVDTIDYSGAGRVFIQKSLVKIENAAPDYIVRIGTSTVDHLYSIERVQWSAASDTLELEDVRVLQDGLLFRMGAESTPQGDRLELAAITQGVLIAPTGVDGQLAISSVSDSTRASWLESLEYVVGTQGNDKIYTGSGLHVADGGGGNDLLDGRLLAAFQPSSPGGYNGEMLGGAGNDTLVGNAGRMLLDGGDGADTFVLTATTTTATKIEMVIENADASDRLYIPYAFFNGTNGTFDGSELMPVLGGIGTPEQAGGGMAYFDWKTESQRWYGTNASHGIITFIGGILFDLEGTDLLVHIYRGTTQAYLYSDNQGGTFWYTEVLQTLSTETIVRVKNYEAGDLGINFYDPGTGTGLQLADGSYVWHYPNYDTIVHTLTAGGARLTPLPARPDGMDMPSDDPEDLPQTVNGTQASDTISLLAGAPVIVASAEGDDAVSTGSGKDVIDGGSGNDTMSGGGGDDNYVVDATGDLVVEWAGGGNDTINSSIDLSLPENVEALILSDGAIAGTGNALDNSIGGTPGDNLLSGGAGNDLLVGAGGRDTLVGGTGNDTYGYTPGDGVDVLHDNGAVSDLDVLIINHGLSPADVAALRPIGAPQDLLLLLSDGGRIYLKGFSVSAAESVDEVHFADGTIWTRSQLQALALAAPAETNAAPVAQDDPWLGIDLPLVVLPKSVLLENDFDPNGNTLTVTAVASGINCIVSLDANGDIVIESATGFHGVASFTYTVSDGLGGPDTATVELALAGALSTSLEGKSGNDSLLGSEADETLHGNAGDDTLAGGAGADALDGGAGTDYASYAGSVVGVLANLGGNFANEGDALGDTYISIEGLIGSEHQDAIYGSSMADHLLGAGGGDDVFGLAGNDTIEGGDGIDSLNAGDGDDVVIGGADWDSLYGDAGNDLLDGVTGDGIFSPDQMAGGTGNDTYIVDWLDTIYENTGDGTDRLLARTDFTLSMGADVEQLFADGVGIETLVGNEIGQTLANNPGSSAALIGGGGNDTISGGSEAEILYGDFAGLMGPGLAGNDSILGGGGNDTVDGEASNDTLRGEAGDDRLLGQAGLDTLFGGDGNDLIEGGSENDQLFGEAGNDTLLGGMGADALAGGDGDDQLDGATGESTATRDTLTGGAGNDTYVVQGDDSIVESAGGGTDTVVARSTYVLAAGISIETLQAATNGIVVTGNDAGQALGNAPGISAELRGGGGADTITGGSGNERLWGDFANGTGAGSAGADEIRGGAGNDTIYGEGGADLLYGEDGNDSLDGATAEAVASQDTLIGGLGSDTYVVLGGDVIVEAAGQGTDVVQVRGTYTLQQDASVETLQAMVAGIIVTGNEIGQTLLASAGIAAELRGGGGNDTVTGNSAADLLWGDFADGTGPGIAGNDSIRGGLGNDTLQGEAGNDTLVGDAGNDVLNGGEGNDSLDGIASETVVTQDTLAGGLGDDTYIVSGTDMVVEGIGGGNDTIIAKSSYTLASGVYVEAMQAAANTIVVAGNGQAQLMTIASGFTAELRGGGGNDTVTGGAGNDIIWGDFAGDTTLAGAGADELRGGSGNDTIYGEAGFDLVIGDGGFDLIYGGDGNDTLEGGLGNDTMYGELAADWLMGGDGNDSLDGGASNDTVYGDAGADVIWGGAGNDALFGGAGSDTFDGGDGADTIWGEAGADLITGGTGIDRFVFRTGFGRDTITDRVAGEILDVQGFGAAYSNLVFTVTAAGLEISSSLFGTGNVIVIGGSTQSSIDQAQFLF